MSQKVPVTGVVEQASPTGFKINGKWFNVSQKTKAEFVPPNAGDSVTFDAYGEQANIVYRYINNNGSSSNGGSGSAGGAGHRSAGVPAGNQVRSDLGAADRRGPASCRAEALIAAATLLAGSEGSVQDVAANAVAVAKAFEVYLNSAAATPAGVTEGLEDGLYWVMEP